MIGTTIGDYRILEKRGEGGMGMFFKAQDIRLDRLVGLKTIRGELLHDPEILGKLEEEAKSLARLDHPNIARLLHYMVINEQRFIVMEYVEGADLAERLRRNGPMSVESMSVLVPQICAALGYAHNRNVVHRDIKPSNILLTSDNTVKVTDFGIAKILGVSTKTKTGVATGSLPYMAPEQIRGTGIDARTDIYQLGVMFFELLAGRRPFLAETEYDMMSHHLSTPPPVPSSLNPSIPTSVDHVVLKALSKDPQDRYARTEELAKAFHDAVTPAVDSKTVYAAPDVTKLRIQQTSKRRLTRSLLLGIGALGFVLALIWLYTSLTKEEVLRRVVVTAGIPLNVHLLAHDLRFETIAEYRSTGRQNAVYNAQREAIGSNRGTVTGNHMLQPGSEYSVSFFLSPADSVEFSMHAWRATDTAAILEGQVIAGIAGADTTMQSLTVPLRFTQFASERIDSIQGAPLAVDELPSPRNADTNVSQSRPVRRIDSAATPDSRRANLFLDVQPFTERGQVQSVWIDGKTQRGEFPMSVQVAKGTRLIRWQIGKDYWTDTVTVGDESVEKSLMYEASRGRINVVASFPDGPGYAEILLDGQETGQGTPGELRDVASGPHQVALRRDGYRAEGGPVIVRVAANDRVRVSISMVPVAPRN